MKRRFWIVLLSLVAVLCLTFALTACGGGKTECEKGNHEFETAWTPDATYHWHKCKNCDEIADKATHVYDNDADRTCNICGYERAAHTCVPATTWSNDNAEHWHVCTVDGCTEKLDKAAHTPDRTTATETEPVKCFVCDYIITPALGHTTHTAGAKWLNDANEHWHKCTGCEEKLDKAAHVYDKEVVADEYRASEATYTEPAKYYKSCVCGAKGTETFNNGSTLSAQDNQIKLKSGVTLGKTYDGAAYSLSADKFTVNGNGVLTFEYKSKDASDWSASAPVNAGDYKVRVSVAATAEWKAAQATFDFAIAKKQLTISGTTVAGKVYDGTKDAVVTAGTLAGLIGNDVSVGVEATGIFASKDVAYELDVEPQDVTVSYTFTGDLAKNYLAPVGETLRATINPKPLSNVNLTKVYDGHGRFKRTALTVEQGLIAGENIKIYVDAIGANVGVYKDGNKDKDFDFNEYVLYIGDSEKQTMNYAWGDTCTATITEKQLVVDFTVDDKYYDGTTEATIADGSLAVSGIVGEDDVTVTPIATFASSAPGNDVTVNVTFALSGAAAGNYCVKDTTVTANIIAKAKLVTASVYLKTKDEGGRHSPVVVNYKPSFLYGSAKSTNATLISFSGNENDGLFMPGETVTATFLLENADYMFVGDTFTLKEGTTEVATGTITSIDGIEVDMLYDKDKDYYTTGDFDFGKTVYANVELADAEWTVMMDTGVATYKVYDSKGAEITVNNGVFTLGASDIVTLVFTPVDGGGVDACAIQQNK